MLELPQEQTGRFTYFIQHLGQTYLNLNELGKASRLLYLAINCARSSHYRQVEAKTLVSLAQIARDQQDTDLALAHLQTAIALLDEMGATCDLAEAYWQLSLTQTQQPETSQISLAKAIHLWQAIPAPQQVARVCNP